MQIFYKTTNLEEEQWKLYGTFACEADWQNEREHIKFLRSMSPIYLKRVNLKTKDTVYFDFDA